MFIGTAHVYWDCKMDNIKAFGQYSHSIIDFPYKYIDLKQDTFKRTGKLKLLSFSCVWVTMLYVAILHFSFF